MKKCIECKSKVDAWNKTCGHCGFRAELVPDKDIKERYLRRPALGALLFTQGWTFGARLYVWFLLSLIPVIGIVVLFACLFFGRRWSWKHGGWASWEEFEERMKLLDMIATVWILGLLVSYLYVRLYG